MKKIPGIGENRFRDALKLRRYGGEVAEVVVFAAVGDGFEVFRIPTVGDTNPGNLTLLRHIDCLLFFYNGIV